MITAGVSILIIGLLQAHHSLRGLAYALIIVGVVAFAANHLHRLTHRAEHRKEGKVSAAARRHIAPMAVAMSAALVTPMAGASIASTMWTAQSTMIGGIATARTSLVSSSQIPLVTPRVLEATDESSPTADDQGDDDETYQTTEADSAVDKSTPSDDGSRTGDSPIEDNRDDTDPDPTPSRTATPAASPTSDPSDPPIDPPIDPGPSPSATPPPIPTPTSTPTPTPTPTPSPGPDGRCPAGSTPVETLLGLICRLLTG
jgi:hypothetical protein